MRVLTDTHTDLPIVVEPAKEQSKRSAHDGRGSFTKYMTLSGEGGGGGEGGHRSCVTHRQMGGLGETQYASPPPPH